LADVMYEASQLSVPNKLEAGEWHLPYVLATTEDNEYMRQQFWEEFEDGKCLSLNDAIITSCARCGAVSYRNNDYDLEKSKEVYNRLVNTDHLHGSALEHCATPIREGMEDEPPKYWDEGISHIDRTGQLWSGNFKGWRQYRKTIKGECYENPIQR
jgi:hypothetical protein